MHLLLRLVHLFCYVLYLLAIWIADITCSAIATLCSFFVIQNNLIQLRCAVFHPTLFAIYLHRGQQIFSNTIRRLNKLKKRIEIRVISTCILLWMSNMTSMGVNRCVAVRQKCNRLLMITLGDGSLVKVRLCKSFTARSCLNTRRLHQNSLLVFWLEPLYLIIVNATHLRWGHTSLVWSFDSPNWPLSQQNWIIRIWFGRFCVLFHTDVHR